MSIGPREGRQVVNALIDCHLELKKLNEVARTPGGLHQITKFLNEKQQALKEKLDRVPSLVLSLDPEHVGAFSYVRALEQGFKTLHQSITEAHGQASHEAKKVQELLDYLSGIADRSKHQVYVRDRVQYVAGHEPSAVPSVPAPTAASVSSVAPKMEYGDLIENLRDMQEKIAIVQSALTAAQALDRAQNITDIPDRLRSYEETFRRVLSDPDSKERQEIITMLVSMRKMCNQSVRDFFIPREGPLAEIPKFVNALLPPEKADASRSSVQSATAVSYKQPEKQILEIRLPTGKIIEFQWHPGCTYGELLDACIAKGADRTNCGIRIVWPREMRNEKETREEVVTDRTRRIESFLFGGTVLLINIRKSHP